jgi:hypothetical protein
MNFNKLALGIVVVSTLSGISANVDLKDTERREKMVMLFKEFISIKTNPNKKAPQFAEEFKNILGNGAFAKKHDSLKTIMAAEKKPGTFAVRSAFKNIKDDNTKELLWTELSRVGFLAANGALKKRYA